MEIDLNFSLQFNEEPEDIWLEKGHVIQEMIEVIEEMNFMNFNYFMDKYVDYTEIKNVRDGMKYFGIEKAPSSSYSANFCKKKDDLKDSLCLHFGGLILQISISLASDNPPSVIAKYKKLVWTIYEKFSHEFVFGPVISISTNISEYPRYRPIRLYKWLESNSIVNFIQPHYYEKINPATKIEGMDHLLNDELPKRVFREQKGDLIMVDWGTDQEINESSITQILMDREDWIYSKLVLKPKSSFTKEGDKKSVSTLALSQVTDIDKFFTYYHSAAKLAFKVCELGENGVLDIKTQEQLVHKSEARKLDDGQEIDRIVLIMPDREQAVSISEKAKELGVYKALYVDDKSNLWDMAPKGDWRN
ncbi:hypothetical protein [Flavivirga jejuensis]|uniref:Uncharacterized protein n=1 Tax=Flavivirga jejuensis TaxID=870487 RepID=A0ABT8WNU6_9FLAO|nr:hypothetical protein [Flavivirga jejuensis]MDO5974854.1 hypothetical protein [Flavivirga jejuensis]